MNKNMIEFDETKLYDLASFLQSIVLCFYGRVATATSYLINKYYHFEFRSIIFLLRQ